MRGPTLGLSPTDNKMTERKKERKKEKKKRGPLVLL
jgi:hypothetical protein